MATTITASQYAHVVTISQQKQMPHGIASRKQVIAMLPLRPKWLMIRTQFLGRWREIPGMLRAQI
jgi:hypothetical protein